VSDRRMFNPVRAFKREFRQEQVSASLKRAMRQQRALPWPLTRPVAAGELRQVSEPQR